MVTETSMVRERKSVSAVALSLLMPGLGHLYCGRIVTGLVLAFLSSISMLVFFLMLVVRTPSWTPSLAVLLAASFSIALFAFVDSWRLARRIGKSYVLKDYNRWYVYTLLVLGMGTGSLVYAEYTKTRFMEAFRVPTVGMNPTIMQGDRILANKIAYDGRSPERGDVIVFPNPDNLKMTFVKRIVALEGETVELRDGALYINGKKLAREPLGPTVWEVNGTARYKIRPADGPGANFGPVTVPKHHVFTLNDNREVTQDSRSYGPIPIVGIKGRVDYIYFPFNHWSCLGKPKNQ